MVADRRLVPAKRATQTETPNGARNDTHIDTCTDAAKQRITLRISHVFIVTLIAMFSALVLSCASDAAPQPTPLMVTIARGEQVLHVFGTHHLLPESLMLRLDDRPPQYLVNALDESDMAFFEVVNVPGNFYQQRVERYMEGNEERPSVQEYVAEWAPERRETFYDALEAFPGLDHVGRRDTILGFQPWAAQEYLGRLALFTLGAVGSNTYMVDNWVMDLARDRELEIAGLEDDDMMLSSRLRSEANQVRDLRYMEAVFHAGPSMEELLEWQRGAHLDGSEHYLRGDVAQWFEFSYSLQGLTEIGVAQGTIEEMVASYDFSSHKFLEREPVLADRLEEFIGDDPVTALVAVGAFHLLPDPDIMLGILLDRGFEVSAVHPESAEEWYLRDVDAGRADG